MTGLGPLLFIRFHGIRRRVRRIPRFVLGSGIPGRWPLTRPVGRVLAVFLLTLICGPRSAVCAPSVLVFETVRAGVHQVPFELLRDTLAQAPAAWDDTTPLEPSRLELSNRGLPEPFWIEGRDDGALGPGARLTWIAEEVRGETTFHHPDADRNVYLLEIHPRPLGVESGQHADADGPSTTRGIAIEIDHFESDAIRRFLPHRSRIPPAHWYWQQLSQRDPEPFRLALEPTAGPLAIRVGLAGLSNPNSTRLRADRDSPTLPSHRVEALLDQEPIGALEWDGQRPAMLEMARARARDAPATELILRVPARRVAAERESILDLVLLDWIEIRRVAGPPRQDRQTRFRAAHSLEAPSPEGSEAAAESVHLELPVTSDLPGTVYGSDGQRWSVDRQATETIGVTTRLGTDFWFVPDGHTHSPEAVRLGHTSPSLTSDDRQADYVILAHPRLVEAVEPLAELHRRRGLRVEVVDLRQVYDQFSAGIVDRRAIRDFLRHAKESWRRPELRFVLLVGDASWEGKGLPGDGEHRDLIPTGATPIFRALVASDNEYVALEGNDILPDLALGRLPVTEPEEVALVVAKIRRALEDPAPRHQVAWISSEERTFVRGTRLLAEHWADRGLTGRELPPPPSRGPTSVEDNRRHRLELRRAFEEGPLLVHFLGHGASRLWRTGQPDWGMQTDLFTVGDIDALGPSPWLPVVLSMTCGSAPFDQEGESLGERFLLVPDRGALAVVGASWRNAPSLEASNILLEELLSPGATLGEALQRAKNKVRQRPFVETYHLLGDPALPTQPWLDPSDRGSFANQEDLEDPQ